VKVSFTLVLKLLVSPSGVVEQQVPDKPKFMWPRLFVLWTTILSDSTNVKIQSYMVGMLEMITVEQPELG